MERLKTYVRRFLIAVVLLSLSFFGATCGYFLHGHDKVHITGTEVKRYDKKMDNGEVKPVDVRLIMARTLDGRTRVYRNEDTGWWPPYLKFNSGTIAGDAMSFAQEGEEAVVLVTDYGMRSTWFSLYPNVLSLREVDKDFQPVPYFNIIVLTLMAIALIAVALGIRRLRRWRPFAKKPAEDEPEAEAAG